MEKCTVSCFCADRNGKGPLKLYLKLHYHSLLTYQLIIWFGKHISKQML